MLSSPETHVRIDFVWFDLGYTLVYTEREPLLARVLADHSVDRSLDDIDKAFHYTDKLFMREFPGTLGKRPEKFMPLYMEKLLSCLDIPLDPKSFTELWMRHWAQACACWKPYENVREVLGRLRGMGVRTGIISNWDPSARKVLKTCCLEDLLDPVIVSCEVGAAKPSEKIFRIALEKASVEPSRCLYVGDNYYDDAAGAATVGMKALIINRFGDFGVEELVGQPIIRDISGIFPYLDGQPS